MAFIPPPDTHRLRVLHAEPIQAHPEEIQHMAEELSQLRRTRGQKTLLDEFAMAALQGILANEHFHSTIYEGRTDLAVRDAYDIAQAMMEARSKWPKNCVSA